MTVAQGRTASDDYIAASEIQKDISKTHNGRLIGLFDLLIENSDRHGGNWFVSPDGEPVPIDHGFAWNGAGWSGGPFAAAIKDNPNLFTVAELNQIRENIVGLESMFAEADSLDWLEYTLRQLDKQIVRAKEAGN